jgi:hypothetical protein
VAHQGTRSMCPVSRIRASRSRTGADRVRHSRRPAPTAPEPVRVGPPAPPT